MFFSYSYAIFLQIFNLYEMIDNKIDLLVIFGFNSRIESD